MVLVRNYRIGKNSEVSAADTSHTNHVAMEGKRQYNWWKRNTLNPRKSRVGGRLINLSWVLPVGHLAWYRRMLW